MTSLRAAVLTAVVGISGVGLSGCGKESSASAQGVPKTRASAAASASVNTKASSEASPAVPPPKTFTRQQLLDRPIPPKPKKPVLPAAARVNTTQGAAAFVKYYFQALDYGLRVGDAKLLIAASHPDCDKCAKRAKEVEKFKAMHVRVLDPTHMVTMHRSLRITSRIVLVHHYHDPARHVRIEDGKGPTYIKNDSRYKAEMAVIWERGQWRVLDAASAWETAEQVRANR